MINKTVDTLLLNSEGHLVPIQMHIGLSPDVSVNVDYLALIKIKAMAEGVMMVNQQGDIEYFTENIGEDFNMKPNQLKNQRSLKIQDICPEFRRILNAFVKYAGFSREEKELIILRNL